jgi:hypothetical protein
MRVMRTGGGKMNVFAYGVRLVNPPKTFENCRGNTETHYYDSEYLHYWIDEQLQFGCEVKATGKIPAGLGWVVRAGVEVDLRGPDDYVIHVRGR